MENSDILKKEIIAHRGASWEAPENTLAAFLLAWEQGADGIEGDFRLTADGEIVCIHDCDTGRVGDASLEVAQSSWAELKAVDVGGWKAARWAGERIPTLAEVLAVVPPGKKVYLEMKVGPEIVAPLVDALRVSTVSLEQVLVIAFDREVIRLFKREMPAAKACLLIDFDEPPVDLEREPDAARLLRILSDLRADGLSTKCHARIDATFVEALSVAGYEYHTWTVDDAAEGRRFFQIGTQSVSTNRPGWLREQLKL